MNDDDWKKVEPIFKRKEFDSPDVAGSGNNMRFGFIYFLFEMRMDLGFPIVISNGGGFRTFEYHKKQDSTHTDISDHTEGRGADIVCNSSTTRDRILEWYYENRKKHGVMRIGVYDKHIHFGMSGKLPQCVAWTGKST